jgi:hypothetical protein
MFTTNPISLKALLNDVALGIIQLPDFQRGWVWDDDRIRGLLASISRGFPVGAIMTLQSGGDINFKTRLVEGVSSNLDNIPERFLLDGQQRLTSLYQALLHDGPVYTQDNRRQRFQRWYYIDMLKAMDPGADREDAIFSVPVDRRVTSDFGREIVLDLSSPELEYQNHMMPTERLLDSMDWVLEYNDYWQRNSAGHPTGDVAKFRNDFKRSILDTFSDYQLPVINLDKDTSKEAVCTVFEKVNTGGVTLNVFELVTASFAAGDFSLRDDWNERRGHLHDGYGVLQGIGGDHFLQAVTLLATQELRKLSIANGTPSNQAPGINCKKDAILNLSLADYQRWANQVEAGFVDAAKFLHSQFVFKAVDLPYNTQLVPLAAIYVELGRELEPANARSRLERWYWSGIFGEVYGGNTETQYALDLPQVAEYVRGGAEPTLVTQANFIPERLLSLRTRNSAAYKGLYALQMKSGAADWRSGESLSIATWDDGHIDIHHIFPKSWCQNTRPPIPQRLYDSVVNKTPIDATTNRRIGGSSPSRYLPRLRQDISSDTLNRVLKAHWINLDTLEADQFAECFVERGEAMLQLIGQAMHRSISGGREVFWNALNSAGYSEQLDDFDIGDVEHDPLGNLAYDDEQREAAD